jgi:hypothetical protein
MDILVVFWPLTPCDQADVSCQTNVSVLRLHSYITYQQLHTYHSEEQRLYSTGLLQAEDIRQDVKQSEKSRRLVRLQTVLVMSVADDGGDKLFRNVSQIVSAHKT